MNVLDNATSVLEEYRSYLHSLPGVTWVDVGFFGRTSPMIRVCMLVGSDLAVVPSFLQGVPVILVTSSCVPVAYTPMGGRVYTPLGRGSAGFFIADRTKYYLITASHLWDPMTAMGAQLIANGRRIGVLERIVPFLGTVKVDASAILIDDLTDLQGVIPRSGGVKGIRQAQIGSRVWKFGTTTGLTTGIVTGIGASTFYPRTKTIVQNLVSIRGMVTKPGDSGGPVFDKEGYIVGIISGGDGVAFAADARICLETLGFPSDIHLLTDDAAFVSPQVHSNIGAVFVPAVAAAALLSLL